MCFSRLKKRRRGQIRTVDFIVSLFLFLLMLSQLILIIINIQFGITTRTIGTLTYEELDIFGRQLLLEEGDPNWGYQQELPKTFGLADSNSLSYLALDSAKITRLITGTPLSVFKMYDYRTLTETIGLERDYDFQLGFYPLFNTKVNVSVTDLAQVQVTNAFNTPISNVQVFFFTIDLTNGEVISEGSTSTDSTGSTSLQLSDPTGEIFGGEHFVFIIVKKGPLWGMNWGFSDPESQEVIIGSSSNTAIWGGGINSSSLLVTDQPSINWDSHFLSMIYETSISNFSNKTIALFDGNEIISIPSEGLVALISIVRNNDGYRVGIGSYPAIMDRDLTSGAFYHVFGELNPSERTKSMLSKSYPINVRGVLMRCQLTLWSE